MEGQASERKAHLLHSALHIAALICLRPDQGSGCRARARTKMTAMGSPNGKGGLILEQAWRGAGLWGTARCEPAESGWHASGKQPALVGPCKRTPPSIGTGKIRHNPLVYFHVPIYTAAAPCSSCPLT